MTQEEAVAELTARFEARLNGLALQHAAQGSKVVLPTETAQMLAGRAVEWAVEQGVTFE